MSTNTDEAVGMVALGVCNVVSCWVIGVYILTYKVDHDDDHYHINNSETRLNITENTIATHKDRTSWHYPQSRPFWGLMALSYGTMPLFGLWDNIVFISKYSNEYLAGFSAFFSVMTLIFLFTSNAIDVNLFGKCNQLNNTYISIILVIISIIVLLLFEIESLRFIGYMLYPVCILPFGFCSCIMIIVYLIKRKNKCLFFQGILMLGIASVVALLGLASLVVFNDNSTLRSYGWYGFCWIGILCLLSLYYLMHMKNIHVRQRD